MIDSNVAYFDANTFGVEGYSMIGPLLLFYEKVVVYGPAGSLIEKAFEYSGTNRTALTPGEFIDFILQGLIIPIGFETFFDEKSRQDLYSPDMRIATEFDKDLVNGPLANYRQVIPDSFKTDKSPYVARKYLENHLVVKNNIQSKLNSKDGIPARYRELLEDINRIPKLVRELIPHSNVNDLIPYMVVYDILNNRHVMEFEGSANVHSQGHEFEFLFRAIHGLENISEEKLEDTNTLAKILEVCINQIEGKRLDAEEIVEFRAKHRGKFVEYVNSAFQSVEGEFDPYLRKEKLIFELQEKIETLRIHTSMGPGKILELLPGLSAVSKEISHLLAGPKKSKRRAFHHFLHQPINPNSRWLYQFIKK